MKDHLKEFCIKKMASVLGVCRSGYYAFLAKGVSQREAENQQLIEKIKEVHVSSRGTYGSPRVHKELKNRGEQYSRKRIAKLMRKENIQAKMRKKWKRTTKVNKVSAVAPNHLDQNFTTDSPDKVWVSDITYVATREGWLYVAVVMDIFSRKIVGLSMGDRLETTLVTGALKQALQHREVEGGLMHHSDRGCQYTSNEFQDVCSEYGIKLSMSAKGYCYDNAVAESFFHTLKTEHVQFCDYRIREEAKNSIFEYVEVFYNRKRLHSTIGYLSPVDFERRWNNEVQHAC